MITIRALKLAGVAGASLALGGCFGPPTPPPVVAVPAPSPVVTAGPVPTVDMAAEPEKVRDILVKRARARLVADDDGFRGGDAARSALDQ